MEKYRKIMDYSDSNSSFMLVTSSLGLNSTCRIFAAQCILLNKVQLTLFEYTVLVSLQLD
jgi:hypothetical protein